MYLYISMYRSEPRISQTLFTGFSYTEITKTSLKETNLWCIWNPRFPDSIEHYSSRAHYIWSTWKSGDEQNAFTCDSSTSVKQYIIIMYYAYCFIPPPPSKCSALKIWNTILFYNIIFVFVRVVSIIYVLINFIQYRRARAWVYYAAAPSAILKKGLKLWSVLK